MSKPIFTFRDTRAAATLRQDAKMARLAYAASIELRKHFPDERIVLQSDGNTGSVFLVVETLADDVEALESRFRDFLESWWLDAITRYPHVDLSVSLDYVKEFSS